MMKSDAIGCGRHLFFDIVFNSQICRVSHSPVCIFNLQEKKIFLSMIHSTV